MPPVPHATANGADLYGTKPGGPGPVVEKKQRSRQQDVPTEPPRRNYAARGIAGLLAPIVRPAFRRRAPAAAQILADWPSLAGPDLASRAAPLKFGGGTLTLGCTGPAAMALQLLSPQIIARLNLALGHSMIERLRFVQQAAPLPQASPPRLHHAPVSLPENLPEGPLGAALARLYEGIKSRDYANRRRG
ncbi:MAG: DUF721 domain-containing protein [Acidocella sp.]|nr:DUF721 domain-containing protein [Acidocella sp.]